MRHRVQREAHRGRGERKREEERVRERKREEERGRERKREASQTES